MARDAQMPGGKMVDMKRHAATLILLALCIAGCSVIYAHRSNVSTHDGDTQRGSNKAVRVELKP
jgi:hypothetical protein